MCDRSKIEWTDATWNPVTGCTKVSPGCKFCYAEALFPRVYGDRPFHNVRLHRERLDQPLRWRKPRRVFVNSMSDLFHEDLEDEDINRVFQSMAWSPRHVFQVLTKRPDRARAHLQRLGETFGKGDWFRRPEDHVGVGVPRGTWPLPNVWLGVSVEDQDHAEMRIPILLRTPAAIRFVSAEPLLGPLDMDRWVFSREDVIREAMRGPMACNRDQADSIVRHPIDWLIVGGESGPHARPMHPDWAFNLRDQCEAANVPFFFKQWGEWASPACRAFGSREGIVRHIRSDGSLWPESDLPDDENADVTTVVKVGKRAAGRELARRTWDEFPSTESIA